VRCARRLISLKFEKNFRRALILLAGGTLQSIEIAREGGSQGYAWHEKKRGDSQMQPMRLTLVLLLCQALYTGERNLTWRRWRTNYGHGVTP
jgi:hypothetical protein